MIISKVALHETTGHGHTIYHAYGHATLACHDQYQTLRAHSHEIRPRLQENVWAELCLSTPEQ